MSLDKENTVDVVGLETATDEVVLSITDSWDWADEPAHLLALQNKINSYFSFISSGQLLEEYPKAAGRKIRIDVLGRYPVPSTAAVFFEKAKAVSSTIDVEFRVKFIGDPPR